MNMNMLNKNWKRYWDRLHVPSRRLVAGALAVAMVLPMTTSAMAAGNDFGRAIIQAVHDKPVTSMAELSDSPEFPDIEIESNFVRDEFGFLTGYLELGLRVKPTRAKSFQSLDVTLDYDTDLLTPVDWNTNGNAIPLGADDPAATGGNYDYYSVKIPAQNIGEASDSSARSGWPETPATGVTAEVADHSRALLEFGVRYDTYEDNLEVSPDGMTTVAVIRFKLKDELKDKIKVKKSGVDSQEYEVYYNGVLVENLFQLKEVMKTAAGSATEPGDGTGGEGEGTTPAAGAQVMELFRFANDGDMDLTDPFTSIALRYESDFVFKGITAYKREYYYTEVTGEAEVTEEHGGESYTMKKSTAKRQLEYPAIDLDAADGDANKYSYLSNLIYNPLTDADKGERLHINFTVASKRSFLDKASYNMTTIVYVDWDNTILGTQNVPKGEGVDVRGLVSDFVAENFIYHDTDKAYTDVDLYDPAQTAAQSGRTARDVVMSLARSDSYRGKYPYDGPQPDGTTTNTVTDGDKYPLTNKLDYVFFKRPMTHPGEEPDPTDTDTYPLGKDDEKYKADLEAWTGSNEWVQKTNTTTGGAELGSFGVGASYDEEHPYAYGWALCTEENYEDVWTTLGSNGELNNYEEKYICPDCGWEATEAEIMDNGGQCVDCASYNADPSMNEGIAKVTYTGEGFQFADLEKGFTEDTVFLKAVYEPGEDLMGPAARYRMIEEPYYTKLSPDSAARGGAYTATFTYERSNNTQGGDEKVRGVIRMREPVVRQEVTTDNLWEQWEDDGQMKVDHDLPNASVSDARDATKSAYIRVTVENKEEVQVALALSGRQNKVNYYLRDEYNSNFVAGSERTLSNIDEMEIEDRDGNPTYSTRWVADNYNYYVDGQSFEKDQWYDASYDDREGSYGFVLFGTLNIVMEKATENGDDYSEFVTELVLNDANIRTAKGVPYNSDNFVLENTAQTILDAAAQAKEAYNSDGIKDWWNEDRNCAELTYHQLQYYIMTYNQGTRKGTLLPDETEAAPISGLTWCHLHKNCADAVSTKPKDWNELLQAAANNPEDIEKLTPTEAEELAHLRKDHNGTALSVTELKDGLVAAVAAGCSTWDEVQDHIIRVQTGVAAAVDVDYARNTYWWYDGATRISLSNWADLLAAAKDSYDVSDNPKAPGESAPVLRQAKLKPLEDAFNSNASDPDNNDPAWVRATENLCVNDDGGKFTSFEAFKDDLADALERAKNEGVSDPDWHQIQYAILHPTAPVPPVKFENTGHEPEMDGYWWHNGERKIVDITSLLQAAKDKNSVWASFSVEQLYDVNRDLHFRKDFKGTKYTSTELASFKSKVETFVGMYGASRSWNDFQFYLLHNYVDDYFVVGDEAVYYWWLANGEGVSVDFSKVTDYSSGLPVFLEAAYKYEVNGNVHAWDDLTTDVIKAARFIKENNGASIFYEETPTDLILVHFDTPAELIAAISGLAVAAGGKGAGLGQTVTLPTATWGEVQYYLLNSQTLPGGGTAPDYWWRTLNKNEAIDPAEYFADAIAALDESIQNWDTTAINDWCKADNLNIVFINVNDPSGAGKFTDDDAQAIVDNDAWNELVINAGFSSGSDVSWYQMQDVLMSGTYNYRSDQDVYDDLTGKGFTIPSWVPAPASIMSVRMMLKRNREDAAEDTIGLLTEQITDLVSAVREDPSLLEENAQQIGELLSAVNELKALVDGVQDEAATESTRPEAKPDVTESPAPTESTEPVESAEPTESGKPSESVKPTESAEPSETPAPTETVDSVGSTGNVGDGTDLDKIDKTNDPSDETAETDIPDGLAEPETNEAPATGEEAVSAVEPAEGDVPVTLLDGGGGENVATAHSAGDGGLTVLSDDGGGGGTSILPDPLAAQDAVMNGRTSDKSPTEPNGREGEEPVNSNFENGIIAVTENYLENESDLSFQNALLSTLQDPGGAASSSSAAVLEADIEEGLTVETLPDISQNGIPIYKPKLSEQETPQRVCDGIDLQIPQSESIGRTMT